MSEDAKAEQIDGLGQQETVSPIGSSAPKFVELCDTLHDEVGVVSPFVDRVIRFISRFLGPDVNLFGIELALHEALANAILHGNQEDPSKRVHVQCRLSSDGEISITVEDEGNGFEHQAVADATAPANRLRTQGRGIYLMRALMDEVEFEKGGSGGAHAQGSERRGTWLDKTPTRRTALLASVCMENGSSRGGAIMKQPSVLEWYCILRAHHQFTIF